MASVFTIILLVMGIFLGSSTKLDKIKNVIIDAQAAVKDTDYLFPDNDKSRTKINVEVKIRTPDIPMTFNASEVWGVYNFTNTKDNVNTALVNLVIDPLKLIKILGSDKNPIISHEMLNENVTQIFEAERINLKNTMKWDKSQPPDEFFNEWRDLDTLNNKIKAITVDHPHCEISVIGRSVQGRDMQIVTCHGPNHHGKPSLYVQSGVYGREYIGLHSTIYALNQIAEGYGNEPVITNLLNNINIYLLPLMNPDGYVHAFTTRRRWKKNMYQSINRLYGVDLNRNWGPSEFWCGSGASNNPNSDTYCGTSVFSEPETNVVKAFITDSVNKVEAVLNIAGCGGGLILSPWEHTTSNVESPYFDQFRQKGAILQHSIEAVNGRVFTEGPTAQVLFKKHGTILDYIWKNHNIFGFEIQVGNGDIGLDPSHIVYAGREVFAAILAFGETLY